MCTLRAFFVLLVIAVCSSSIIAQQRSTFEFDVDAITAVEHPFFSISRYQVRIIRTGNLGQPASVVLSTEDGTATGTGPQNDFASVNRTFEFAPNQSLIVWETTIRDDEFREVYEGTEWFFYKLSNPSSNSVIGQRNSLTVRIDDSFDTPEVKLDGAFIIEPGVGRSRRTTTVGVVLRRLSVEPVSVQISAEGGTATEGIDYVPFSQVVTVPPMTDYVSVPITILGDGLPEPRERIGMKLSNPINGIIGIVYDVEIINAAPYSAQPDFDGDGSAEGSTFNTATSTWNPALYGAGPVTFGSVDDVIVPGEYTGDGVTDIAVWRPATGTWWVLRSEDGSHFAFQFGMNGDIPITADYDGDGIADFALYRPSTGTWFIQRSTDGGYDVLNFGLSTDKPVPADYDGDWKADIAVFRGNGASTAQWWIRKSSDGSAIVNNFGLEGDRLVPLDYTGDGKADLSVWRPSTENWYVVNSADNSVSVRNIGIGDPNSVPAPARYGYSAGGSLTFSLLAPGNSSIGPRWVGVSNGQTYSSPAAGDRALAGAYVR